MDNSGLLFVDVIPALARSFSAFTGSYYKVKKNEKESKTSEKKRERLKDSEKESKQVGLTWVFQRDRATPHILRNLPDPNLSLLFARSQLVFAPRVLREYQPSWLL